MKLTLIFLAASLAAVTSARCGRSRTFSEEADNGQTFKHTRLPWLVAIYANHSYRCSGTLIRRNLVLTAGHCIKEWHPTLFTVHAGEWHVLQEKHHTSNYQRRNVLHTVVHENFTGVSSHGDYGLLFLSRSFQLTDSVNSICLPPADQVFDESSCLESRWIRSWLQREDDARFIATTIEVSLVDHQVCQDAIRKSKNNETFVLEDTAVCAKSRPGTLPIPRSGGSPLSCPLKGDPKRYVLVGLLSWGIENDDAVPDIFASVAQVTTWIRIQVAIFNYRKQHGYI